MGSAKEISVRVIPASIARPFVKSHHYSGKVVNNSKLHFGAFLDGKLHGVMSFGPPMDKSKVLGLVVDANGNPAPWHGMLELNRMAFDDVLPKNSESRAISVAVRLIRKYAPQVKWILSFADGTQCGDGTIYRASGFKLTDIRGNKNTARLPDGSVLHKMTLESNPTQKRADLGGVSYYDITGGRFDFSGFCKAMHAEVLEGFQLRYIKIIDQTYHLAVPELPFSAIAERGAGMYKGEKR